MLTALEQKRIRDLITETVKMLCQNSLNFRSKFTVEGLLGITIDDKEVFLVNIHEVISSRSTVVREKLVYCDTAENNEISTLSESHGFMQPSKTQPPKTLSLLHSDHPQQFPASQNMLSYDQLDEEIAHSFKPQSIQLGKLLRGGKKTLETRTSLISVPVTDGSELSPSTPTECCELQDRVVTVKEEITSDSETNASHSHLDFISHDLHMECNSVWPDKQNTYMKV